MSNRRACRPSAFPPTSKKIIAGVPVFPDCGCTYTTDDDGIEFCALHAAAEDLLTTGAAYLKALDEMKKAKGFTTRIAAALICHFRLKEFRAMFTKVEGK